MVRANDLIPTMVAFLFLAVSPPATAQATHEETSLAEITAALTQWRDDFNAGRADVVCDLFAAELRADFRGQPERSYGALCDLLQSSLADAARDYSYDLAIKEILVWDDVAVVRLTWTLTVRQSDSGLEATSVEPGLDVFRRQEDGRWRIVRYMAYER